MKLKQIAGAAAALLLGLSMVGPAMADPPPPASEQFDMEVTEGILFSVSIIDSRDFPDRVFTLGAADNYAAQAWYTLQVVDMRGTGVGWNVTAGASAFTPAVPGSGLRTRNNGQYWSCMNPLGYCATPGSIVDGVGVHAGDPNIIAGAASVIHSGAGQTSAPSPYGSGTFSTNETLYYIGFPNALQVGTYSSTVTLTLSGTAP